LYVNVIVNLCPLQMKKPAHQSTHSSIAGGPADVARFLAVVP
jgi:hypothetical protein